MFFLEIYDQKNFIPMFANFQNKRIFASQNLTRIITD